MFKFENSVFEGENIPDFANLASEFQIIPNNPGFSPYIDGCTPYEGMNAYICVNEHLG
jgi:hypothetical protein